MKTKQKKIKQVIDDETYFSLVSDSDMFINTETCEIYYKGELINAEKSLDFFYFVCVLANKNGEMLKCNQLIKHDVKKYKCDECYRNSVSKYIHAFYQELFEAFLVTYKKKMTCKNGIKIDLPEYNFDFEAEKVIKVQLQNRGETGYMLNLQEIAWYPQYYSNDKALPHNSCETTPQNCEQSPINSDVRKAEEIMSPPSISKLIGSFKVDASKGLIFFYPDDQLEIRLTIDFGSKTDEKFVIFNEIYSSKNSIGHLSDLTYEIKLHKPEETIEKKKQALQKIVSLINKYFKDNCYLPNIIKYNRVAEKYEFQEKIKICADK